MHRALFLVGYVPIAAGRDWALHKLNQTSYPLARCLDGSPGAFYVQPGIGDAARTFVMHLQGGGWCWGLNNCAERAFGSPVYPNQPSLGSSNNWGPGPCVPGTAQTNSTPPCVADGDGGGAFSSDATMNPLLADATKVWFGYCSGDSFAGFVSDPVPVNASMSLYFRGHAILDAILATLASDFNLGSANAVLLKGCSAGGEAVYYLANHVEQAVARIAPAARFAVMPGAGYLGFGFPAMNGTDIFSPELQWVFDNMGLEAAASKACLAARPPEDAWLCFRSDVALLYIHAPVFVVNSLADAVQMAGVLNLGCWPPDGSCSASQLAYLDQFSAAMASRVVQAFQERRNDDGAFLVSCAVHVLENLDGSWARIPVQGLTQAQAFANWWTNSSSGGRVAVDSVWTQGSGKPHGGNPACGNYGLDL